MGECWIVGAGEFTPRGFTPGAQDLVIAADGGYTPLKAMGVAPHLLLGDFDSIGTMPSDVPVLQFPAEKDDTDMGIAIQTAFDRGYRSFRLYGGGGGRIDHLVANMQTMCRFSKLGAQMRLTDSHCDLFCITDATLLIPPLPEGTTVSVFCHGEQAQGVTLLGMKYSLTDATLTSDVPLGVSNRVQSGRASVTVREGTLIVFCYLQPEFAV